jgi:hypothetical protein
MNYDATVIQMIESLKADKSIPPEYRNAVISSARRLQLEIRGARSMTNLRPPEAQPTTQAAPVITVSQCTCTLGMPPRKDCPVHREKV